MLDDRYSVRDTWKSSSLQCLARSVRQHRCRESILHLCVGFQYEEHVPSKPSSGRVSICMTLSLESVNCAITSFFVLSVERSFTTIILRLG